MTRQSCRRLLYTCVLGLPSITVDAVDVFLWKQRQSTNVIDDSNIGYLVEQWQQSESRGQVESVHGRISDWDTSRVEDMVEVFQGMRAFNEDISNWDTSRVTHFDGMFAGAVNFDQDLSTWDFSSAKSLEGMFKGASKFNGDISTWELSSVTKMGSLFRDATSFNTDISAWDTSNVIDMNMMFFDAIAFDGDLSMWDVSSVSRMDRMFTEATSFQGVGIAAWDTSNVETMYEMFKDAVSFQEDVSTWDMSKVSFASRMFYNAGMVTGELCWNNLSPTLDISSAFCNTPVSLDPLCVTSNPLLSQSQDCGNVPDQEEAPPSDGNDNTAGSPTDNDGTGANPEVDPNVEDENGGLGDGAIDGGSAGDETIDDGTVDEGTIDDGGGNVDSIIGEDQQTSAGQSIRCMRMYLSAVMVAATGMRFSIGR